MNQSLALKKLLIFSIILSIPVFAFAASPTELSQKIEEVRREHEALVEERERLQAELEKVNLDAQTLGTAVKSLDVTRKKLAADIRVTQSKIASTDLTIKSLENSVSTAERRIIAHKKAIGNAIQVLSQYDSRPLILDILASASLSDIWRDRTQLESLSVDLEAEVENLKETRVALTQEKEKKEEAKKEILSLHSELSGQKVVVEESQKAKKRLLAETKNKEAEYQRLIQENIARQRESESDLYRLEQTLRITLDPTLFPEARNGILNWPLANVFITNKFGKSNCAIYPPPACFHNGLDFRASMGTPVLAMADGVVAGSDNTDRQKGCYSYGSWVLIRYDNGLSSVYAHLSRLIVNDGDRIKAGQVVAYSGGAPRWYGSGYSTAQHLHIGLFPSQGVEVRLFTTSNGCKQVYVPLAKGQEAYLDPLAYLPSI